MKNLLVVLLAAVLLGLLGGCVGTGGYYGAADYSYYGPYGYPYAGPEFGYYSGYPVYGYYYFDHFRSGHRHYPPAVYRPHDDRRGHHGTIDQRRHTVRDRHPGNVNRDPGRRLTRDEAVGRQQIRERDGFSGRSSRERISREPGLRCGGPNC